LLRRLRTAYEIPARHGPHHQPAVVIPNHIFNEIEVSGRRFVVDANSGLIFDRSWEELSTHPDQRVFVYTLPLVGLMDAASANYRPRLGQLRSVLVRTVGPGNAARFPEPPVAQVISSRALSGTKER
jgi:hypothetical protein